MRAGNFYARNDLEGIPVLMVIRPERGFKTIMVCDGDYIKSFLLCNVG